VLTQLKLLRILQEDLNSRYRTLTAGDDASSAAGELAEIAAQQGKLAELALKLAQPPDENPEDNPESLPDLRKGDADPEAVPPLDSLIDPPAKESPQ
jgi:hypothetical protein